MSIGSLLKESDSYTLFLFELCGSSPERHINYLESRPALREVLNVSSHTGEIRT
jgi:hypothetical protein